MKRSVMLTLIILLLVLTILASKVIKKPHSAEVSPDPTAATSQPVTQASPDVYEETAADADAAELESADEPQADQPAPPSSDTPSAPASPPKPDAPASQPSAQTPAAPAASAPASADPLPGSSLADSLRSGKPTMVDFGAGWCRACQEQEPILHQAVARYRGKANIVYVDTGEYADLTRQYGIRLIPTQIFFDAQGNEVSRHMGVYPMADIDREFAALGATP